MSDHESREEEQAAGTAENTPVIGATEPEPAPARKRAARKRTAKKLEEIELPPAPDQVDSSVTEPANEPASDAEPETVAPRRRAARKRTTPRPAPRSAGQSADSIEPAGSVEAGESAEADESAEAPAPKKRSRRKVAAASPPVDAVEVAPEVVPVVPGAETPEGDAESTPGATMPLFQAPEPVGRRPRRAASRPAGPPRTSPEPDGTDAESAEQTDAVAADEIETVETEAAAEAAETPSEQSDTDPDTDLETETDTDTEPSEESEDADAPRRRRRRGGRGRRGRGRSDSADADSADADVEADAAEEGEPAEDAQDDASESDEATADGGGSSRRRRRRRRRGNGGSDGDNSPDDPPNTVTKVRDGRSRDDVAGLKGSTRLEAKRQRRREGREAGRRRSVISEAEFLARRESVERVMVVRERDGRTQIGVLEDGVLVEHYVARKTQTSMVGNVYLGRVQNVLPSMEAAFIDIGKGRNAVLYAGEVNWDAAGLDGQPRRIENALKAGEPVLVQVTKDPIGHKGARLTSQISMPGRYLVYVPDGSMTGISRKLPENERNRLKQVLKAVVPDSAGVIVRTAAEGASDVELERDVARLQAQWEDIDKKTATGNAPSLLYAEPDLAIRVVRDIFNEDIAKLVVSGDDAWDTLQGYVGHVAPDLVDRLQRWDDEADVFAGHRIDEQLHKALERKVWLPSGGSLVIDRTEAMTVVDVNTGKFTGSGGNLEETVTKNNIEAAEEVVRQLRLRDIGGIIVVDFIDMVLESNRDLVLRRLLECLGRDRTRHQVAEVTSLGLVQMTRKRVGQGLVEVFSETCEHCGGRGLIMHDEPVERKPDGGHGGHGGHGGGGRRGRNQAQGASS